jgi:ADP-ribosylglycohydrolase
MSFTLFPDARGALAADSLAGLSVGDALGAQFFVPGTTADDLPAAPRPWTDDTEEACCLVATLAEGDFDRDAFAAIAGGVVAAYAGTDGIPQRWLAAREPLPGWLQVTY